MERRTRARQLHGSFLLCARASRWRGRGGSRVSAGSQFRGVLGASAHRLLLERRPQPARPARDDSARPFPCAVRGVAGRSGFAEHTGGLRGGGLRRSLLTSPCLLGRPGSAFGRGRQLRRVISPSACFPGGSAQVSIPNLSASPRCPAQGRERAARTRRLGAFRGLAHPSRLVSASAGDVVKCLVDFSDSLLRRVGTEVERGNRGGSTFFPGLIIKC